MDLAATDGEDRIWILIDGERRFVLASECLIDSFLAPKGASDSILKYHAKSDSERVIDYGFCVEDCCASTLATIEYAESTVRWTRLRYSVSEEIVDSAGFEFDRAEYESEIRRVLVALVAHYKRLYCDLRWPQTAKSSD